MVANSHLIFWMISSYRVNCNIIAHHTDISTAKMLAYQGLYTKLPWGLYTFLIFPFRLKASTGVLFPSQELHGWRSRTAFGCLAFSFLCFTYLGGCDFFRGADAEGHTFKPVVYPQHSQSQLSYGEICCSPCKFHLVTSTLNYPQNPEKNHRQTARLLPCS